MRTRKASDVSENEITDRGCVLQRRDFMRVGVGTAAGLLVAGAIEGPLAFAGDDRIPGAKLSGVKRGPAKFQTDEEPTSIKDATSYNNFYEFGTDKRDPARNAHTLRTEPWTVLVDGECEKPGKLAFEDLIAGHTLEERVYRLRCVEAWSMVIPWVGIPLGDVLKKHQPTSKAKYVAFETLFDSEQMPGQRRRVLDWPYREGLRIDEAMHPLTILAVGMYGEVLPNQNGAPLRLVVPWKYGFKSIKSIVRIHFSESEPYTTWNAEAPGEYGFYANVNPDVNHPRWSQSRERRIGEFSKRPTLPFNGYAEEVAGLYQGMDLRKSF